MSAPSNHLIVCQTCGEHNAPNAEFCGNCGDFLKWTGAQVQAGPVRPDARPAPQQTHRPQRTLKRQPQPGDLICGQCGSGNVPTRKFCGVCGYSLIDAVTQKQPWWKRWLPRKGPKVRERGSRPRRVSRFAKVRHVVGRAFRWVLALAVLLFGLLYGFSQPFRTNVNTRVIDAKDTVAGKLFEDWVPIRQSSISASQEQPEHPAGFAMDLDTGSFWAAKTDPKTAALTIQFDRTTDLRRLIIHSGDPKKFLGSARPQRLTLVFDTGETDDITLTDTREKQEHGIKNGNGVKQVQILVAGVYPSTESTDTVISEIELFEREVK
ncbi:NADase-type glycan-binding domain-containing protein [Lentzea sp. NPDC051213]|uniref:NADase-type glycan-binding domain-containing protein n=1 Tax=Lentzea sp. NPDC051213 TaxID=3364126 RepID=UPI00379F7CF7